MSSDIYKLTGAGGFVIRRGSIENIGIELIGQHDGLRFVRRMSDPLTVMTIDVQQKRFDVSRAGSPMPDREVWQQYGHWPDLLWRLLVNAIPTLKGLPT